MSVVNEVMFFVLAGGIGSRFKRVDPSVPKVIASIKGKSIIEYIYQVLPQQFKSRFVVCTGVDACIVEEYLNSVLSGLMFSREKVPLGTGGAIKNALSQFNCPIVIVQNGDTFLDIDYEDMLRSHIQADAAITIGVRRYEGQFGVGGILVDSKGGFSAFDTSREKGHAYVNAGIYIIDVKFLTSKFPSGVVFSFEEDVLSHLGEGDRVYLYDIQTPFYDMGTPEGYKCLTEFLLSRSLSD